VPELIKAYVEQLQEGQETYFVADSAMYSEENLRALSEVKWVTRVPERIGLAKSLEEAISVADMNERSYLVSNCYFLMCEKVAIDNERSHLVFSCYSRSSEKFALEVDV
jgi:transposase